MFCKHSLKNEQAWPELSEIAGAEMSGVLILVFIGWSTSAARQLSQTPEEVCDFLTGNCPSVDPGAGKEPPADYRLVR